MSARQGFDKVADSRAPAECLHVEHDLSLLCECFAFFPHISSWFPVCDAASRGKYTMGWSEDVGRLLATEGKDEMSDGSGCVIVKQTAGAGRGGR